MPKCLQILRHKKRSPLLYRQCLRISSNRCLASLGTIPLLSCLLLLRCSSLIGRKKEVLFSDWSKKEATFFLLFGASCQGFLFDAQEGEKPSMFLASDAIKRHFGVHTESQESSSLPVAKHFLGLCFAR